MVFTDKHTRFDLYFFISGASSTTAGQFAQCLVPNEIICPCLISQPESWKPMKLKHVQNALR